MVYMLVAYLIVVNIIALFLYGYDKQCAKAHRWRISEKALLTSAFIGGSLGAYVGMMSFRHKTNHKIFQICVPLLLIIQMIGLIIIVM